MIRYPLSTFFKKNSFDGGRGDVWLTCLRLEDYPRRRVQTPRGGTRGNMRRGGTHEDKRGDILWPSVGCGFLPSSWYYQSHSLTSFPGVQTRKELSKKNLFIFPITREKRGGKENCRGKLGPRRFLQYSARYISSVQWGMTLSLLVVEGVS